MDRLKELMGFNKIFAEYVWIGGNNELRSKVRVLDKKVSSVNELPVWNFDGSSTEQAEGKDSEVLLVPRCIFNDPIRGSPHILVLCETTKPDGSFLKNSHRHWANEMFENAKDEEPWFGLEQEYFMIDMKTGKPLGLENAKEQGQYYCSVGAANAFGRDLAEEHMRACVNAGIKISGINAEVAPGQWEFQIGPCTGIEEGDHMWMARFLLDRLSENHGIKIDYEPKPLDGDWNGSGCHANYSTKKMREGTDGKSGLEYIDEAIEKLSHKHMEHMETYGSGNEKRMTGKHETASYDTFSHGTANRGASIRRGNQTVKDGKGYFEDRRPSSNCDPYLVSGMLFKTTIIDE
jgi:glutamine synthetase